MKKHLVIFFTLLAISGPSILYGYIGYQGIITNNTSVQIRVKIELAVCKDKEIWVNPGEKIEVRLGGCCTKRAIIYATKNNIHVEPQYYPPQTGFGIACRGWELIVNEAPTLTPEGFGIIVRGT